MVVHGGGGWPYKMQGQIWGHQEEIYLVALCLVYLSTTC